MKKIIWLSLILFTFQAQAQLSEERIDELVEETMKQFEVPGISVGVIKDGRVVYAKGHGVRSTTTQKPMDAETLVGIASNSKGFTCVALAMMVDEGKLNWDDPVKKYIPEFEVYDPYVSQEFTIRDLVTHRSGFPLGAGDLMFFPEGGDFTVDDVIHNMRNLKQESSFRSEFKYNNNMFIIAGEVLKRVSGLEWAEFMEQKIFPKVGMTKSKGTYNHTVNVKNKIDAHARSEGKIKQIPHDWHELANPAGGIMSNIDDMLKWADFLMEGTEMSDGERLLSQAQMSELWTLQTPMKPRGGAYKSHFRGYGLGWFLSDQDGHFQVRHSGGLLGTVTQFTLLPDMKLGIVVLTNQMEGGAFVALTNAIKDSYLGYEDRNWVDIYGNYRKNWLDKNDSIKTVVFDQVDKMKKSRCILSPSRITGTYNDSWMGDFVISEKGKDIIISSIRSPRLKGVLLPYNETTMVAKWDDRSYDADVFVKFAFDKDGNAASATMEYIAPITDFSFDFHDMELVKVKQ